jgi:hypothetical protein
MISYCNIKSALNAGSGNEQKNNSFSENTCQIHKNFQQCQGDSDSKKLVAPWEKSINIILEVLNVMKLNTDTKKG